MEELARWAEGLVPARLSGGSVADPPEPIGLEAGYALADRNADRLGSMVGWKVGATSPGAMQALGVAEPIRGRLYAERIWQDGAAACFAGDRAAEAEPEIAFRLARTLTAGGDPMAAIGAAYAAAEIVRPSSPRAFELGAGFIVADNSAGLGVLLGPELPLAALRDPGSMAVTLMVEDETGAVAATTRGTADAVLGDPLRALAWLAGALGEVPAASLVMSGAIARAVALPPAGRLVVEAEGQRAALRLGPGRRATI